MYQDRWLARRRLTAGMAVWLVLAALPTIASAQGSPWDVEGEPGPGGPAFQFPGNGATEALIGPITFDEPELPLATVIDGLVLNTLNGVPLAAPLSFGFTVGGVPSMDCTVNLGPPAQMYVQPPGIEGDAAGTLSIDFGTDVSSVEFGFALACVPPAVSPGATVTAYDAAMNPVGMVTLDAIDTGNAFVENLVQLAPGTFRSIEATWNPICGRFLFDNLSYEEVVPTVLEVPTLGAAGLAVLAVLVLSGAVFLLRRRAR